MPFLAAMFILILTVFQPGKGPVTTRSEPMELAACHAEMAVKMKEAGDKLVRTYCEGVQ